MSDPRVYVRFDEHSVFRVGQTDISLDSVVIAHLKGHSPESIRRQYPALDLEEVYGSIAYFLANRDEVQQYLARQEKVWDGWRRKTEAVPSPVVERLRAMQNVPTASLP